MRSFAPRLTILKALAQHVVTEPKEREKLLLVLDRLNRLHKARNNLIHASYLIHADHTKRKPKVTLRKQITRASRAILQTELIAQTSEIEMHLYLLASLSQFLIFSADRFPSLTRLNSG